MCFRYNGYSIYFILLFYIFNLFKAGQDEFKALRPQYMRVCYGFALIFDLTSRESFIKLEEFIGEIKRTREIEQFPAVLVGNKLDLAEGDRRKVSLKEMKDF